MPRPISFGGIFLRSTALSIMAVGGSGTLLMAPEVISEAVGMAEGGRDYGENESRTQYSSLMIPDDPLYMRQYSPDYCSIDFSDRRSGQRYCQVLHDIIEVLEEMEEDFSRRVYLAHPTSGKKIGLWNVLHHEDSATRETFPHYFEPRPELENSRFKTYMETFRHQIYDAPITHKPIKYSKKHLPEIEKYFPNLRGNQYHNWRIKAILKRLARRGEDIVLMPMDLRLYYHFFRTPTLRGLMVKEAQHFYFSAGSKWAGWRDENHLENFTEALNEYLPSINN